MKAKPQILFFDSGLGGLSVYEAVRSKTGKEAVCHYLFDHECFPYGTKSEEFLVKRVQRLISAILPKVKPDLAVIACNTASTVVLPKLRHDFDVPFVGVVPAIKPAALSSVKKIIGILATPGTVHRSYTQELIDNFASDCKVYCIGTDKLVRLAEDYLTGYPVDQNTVDEIVAPWRDLEPDEAPDVAVLGCTHFPLVREYLQKALPHMLLLDSGEAIGRRVCSLLKEQAFNVPLQAGAATDEEEPQEERPGLEGQTAFYTGTLEDEERFLKIFKRFGFESLQRFEP